MKRKEVETHLDPTSLNLQPHVLTHSRRHTRPGCGALLLSKLSPLHPLGNDVVDSGLDESALDLAGNLDLLAFVVEAVFDDGSDARGGVVSFLAGREVCERETRGSAISKQGGR
jgi:hypothetical protein